MRSNDWLVVALHAVLHSVRVIVGDDGHGATSGVVSGQVADKSMQLRYRVLEQQARGTFVGNVLVDARLATRFSLDVLRHIRFRFLTDSNPLLSIDPLSGVLTTGDVIDRDAESLCRQRDVCEINVDVVLQPVQYFQVIKVNVEIIDINDNAPTFADASLVIGIPESALVGSIYVVQGAVDYDSPNYGIQKYELDSESNKLDLQINTKVDGTQEVRLILKEKLDREIEPQCTLKLFAVDGGPNPMTGSATVTINVLDSNDNKPRFIGGPNIEVSVVENTPPGTVVVRVQAVDNDDGINGLVEYSFARSTINSPGGQAFAIRNNTGEIVVRGVIDHEKTVVYQLIIVATDRGHDPLSSEATVVIRVEDLNDNAPALSIRTLSGSGSAEIHESSPIGTFVAHVTVVDQDSGANGRVNCSVTHPTAFGLIQKYATEYQLVTAAVLDRERTAQYSLVIRCQDGGGARVAFGAGAGGAGGGRVSRVAEKSLQVVLIDDNDNSPLFSQMSYQGTIIENNYIGLSVLQVSATDADLGDNAYIQYIIPGNVSVLFHVDQRGLITALAKIDREQKESYRFPVTAVDGGVPPRTGSALVVIKVDDVNDERPRFVQSSYAFKVWEHELPGTQVGNVFAEDKDGPLYNSVGYSFISSNTAVDAFSIDPVTGHISTRSPLDREAHGLYHLMVTAYDRKMASYSTTATVNIQVLDKNDNSPIFFFPHLRNNTLYISSQTPINHVIGQVVARDADIDENARVTYRIIDDVDDDAGSSRVSGDGGPSPFRIDPDRGLVYVNSRFETVTQNTYRLTLQAVDHGVPARKETALLNIVVDRKMPFGSAMQMTRTGSSTWYYPNTIVLVFSLFAGALFLVIVAIVVACAVRRRRQLKRQQSTNGRRHNQRHEEAIRGLTSLPTTSSSSSTPAAVAASGCGGVSADRNAAAAAASPSKSSMKPPVLNGNHNRYVDQPSTANGKLSANYVTTRPSASDILSRPMDDVIDGVDVTAERLNNRHHHHRHVPPPPPPPRGGLFWRQQQQQQHEVAQRHPVNAAEHNFSTLQGHDHVTDEQRRPIGGDVTLRRVSATPAAGSQRPKDDRSVYHIADCHGTMVRTHVEVVV